MSDDEHDLPECHEGPEAWPSHPAITTPRSVWVALLPTREKRIMPLLTKANLELAKLASDNASRFMLNAIHITPTEVCVTDGHILATLETSKQSCESWPSAGRGEVTNDWKPFNLDAKVALDLARRLPKKTTIPVLSCAAIVDGDESVTVIATDLEQDFTAKAKRNGANFPEYKRVIWNPDEATFAFNLNAANLAVIATFVEKLNGSKRGVTNPPSCVLRFKSARDAVRIEAQSTDGEKFLALLMPAKSDDISALDSTPEIIKRARSGKTDSITEAIDRRDMLRAQLAELDQVLDG